MLIGDRLFVSSVDNELLKKEGMKRSTEIISINGENPREYANRELLPYISASTPQWADHMMFDGDRLTEGRKNSELTISLSSGNGAPVTEIIAKRDRKPASKSYCYSFRTTTDNVGVLTLGDFASSEVTEFFASVYQEILKTESLLIDLRGNDGGNSNHADYILRHLTTDSIACNNWTTPIYMPAYASWGRQPSVYVSSSGKVPPIEDKSPYLKPIVVVIYRGTFSAAEDFCALFRGMNRGLIAGTPSGGSTGNGVRVQLTKGIWANICSKHDRMADGTEFVGVGIIPDVTIELTPEEYFSDSEDAVIGKAKSLLR